MNIHTYIQLEYYSLYCVINLIIKEKIMFTSIKSHYFRNDSRKNTK